MSTTAVGKILVDATAPSAPAHNLLATPGVLLPGAERWDGGINMWGYTDALPLTWDACSTGTFRVKDDEGGNVPMESFDSFVIYLTQICSTLGIANDLGGFAERANVVLEATQSFALEKALAQGVGGLNDNKYLGDADLDVLAQGVSPAVALSWLENAIGATGRKGMIHVTPAVGTAIFQITRSPVTPDGNNIVIGAGYIGTDPVASTSPSSGKDWAFATGPVQARLSELLTGPEEVSGMVDHETNDVVYRAEKLASVGWDGALQAGVLVDWTLQ